MCVDHVGYTHRTKTDSLTQSARDFVNKKQADCWPNHNTPHHLLLCYSGEVKLEREGWNGRGAEWGEEGGGGEGEEEGGGVQNDDSSGACLNVESVISCSSFTQCRDKTVTGA